jgi:hypothetical protein
MGPQHLHSYLRPELESEFRELRALACSAGEQVLQLAVEQHTTLADGVIRANFLRAAHRGFSEVQKRVSDRLLTLERMGSLDPAAINEIHALRKVVDSIAWQVISEQLYVARRLFNNQRPYTAPLEE